MRVTLFGHLTLTSIDILELHFSVFGLVLVSIVNIRQDIKTEFDYIFNPSTLVKNNLPRVVF